MNGNFYNLEQMFHASKAAGFHSRISDGFIILPLKYVKAYTAGA